MQGCGGLIFRTEDYCFIPENSPMSVVRCSYVTFTFLAQEEIMAIFSFGIQIVHHLHNLKPDSRNLGRKGVRAQTRRYQASRAGIKMNFHELRDDIFSDIKDEFSNVIIMEKMISCQGLCYQWFTECSTPRTQNVPHREFCIQR